MRLIVALCLVAFALPATAGQPIYGPEIPRREEIETRTFAPDDVARIMVQRGYSDITFIHTTPPVYVAQACRAGTLYLVDANQAAIVRERMALGPCPGSAVGGAIPYRDAPAVYGAGDGGRGYGGDCTSSGIGGIRGGSVGEREPIEDCGAYGEDGSRARGRVIRLLEKLNYRDVAVLAEGETIEVEACLDQHRYRMSFRSGAELLSREDAGACVERSARTFDDRGARYDRCEEELTALAKSSVVTFESGSALLSNEAKTFLLSVAAAADRCDGAGIEVAGYSDPVGDRIKNLYLSQKRADAVADFLVQNGMERHRIAARGYGAGAIAETSGYGALRRTELIVTRIDH